MSDTIYALIEKHINDPVNYVPETIDHYFECDFSDIDEYCEDESYTKNGWGAPTGETNIFYGGEIQRRAHAEGRHEHYKSEAGKKSWTNRCKKTATKKMVEGYKRHLSTPEGKKQHIEKSKKAAQSAKLVIAQKVCYNGQVYVGWSELKRETGISKYMFLKYNLGELL